MNKCWLFPCGDTHEHPAEHHCVGVLPGDHLFANEKKAQTIACMSDRLPESGSSEGMFGDFSLAKGFQCSKTLGGWN